MTFRYILEKGLDLTSANRFSDTARRYEHNLESIDYAVAHATRESCYWETKPKYDPDYSPFFPARDAFRALREVVRDYRAQCDNVQWSEGYVEPGYTDPDKGVLRADWNYIPQRTQDCLERAGYALEWEDEWFDCGDCGKLVRHSADCYSWEPHFVLLNECEVVCLDCLKQNGAAEYIRELEDDPTRCVMGALDPADYGYELVDPEEYDYETGWHAGQTDDPKKVLEELHNRGIMRVVFQISETSQFYHKWRAYAHPLRKGAVVRVKGELEDHYVIAEADPGYNVIVRDNNGHTLDFDPDELEVV